MADIRWLATFAGWAVRFLIRTTPLAWWLRSLVVGGLAYAAADGLRYAWTGVWHDDGLMWGMRVAAGIVVAAILDAAVLWRQHATV